MPNALGQNWLEQNYLINVKLTCKLSSCTFMRLRLVIKHVDIIYLDKFRHIFWYIYVYVDLFKNGRIDN